MQKLPRVKPWLGSEEALPMLPVYLLPRALRAAGYTPWRPCPPLPPWGHVAPHGVQHAASTMQQPTPSYTARASFLRVKRAASAGEALKHMRVRSA